MRPRRTEDGDALRDRGEVIEALDELAHDAHHAPRIRPRKIRCFGRCLQELLIFGDGTDVAANRVVDDARRTRGTRSRPFRWWGAAGGAVTRFRALSQILLRLECRFGE